MDVPNPQVAGGVFTLDGVHESGRDCVTFITGKVTPDGHYDSNYAGCGVPLPRKQCDAYNRKYTANYFSFEQDVGTVTSPTPTTGKYTTNYFEQIIDVPKPQVWKEIMQIVRFNSQERISERILQTVGFTVGHVRRSWMCLFHNSSGSAVHRGADCRRHRTQSRVHRVAQKRARIEVVLYATNPSN